jgi:hypothetical protein
MKQALRDDTGVDKDMIRPDLAFNGLPIIF